jgi:hypothetical protein
VLSHRPRDSMTAHDGDHPSVPGTVHPGMRWHRPIMPCPLGLAGRLNKRA